MGQSIQEWTKQILWKPDFTWSILEYFVPYELLDLHCSVQEEILK